MSVRLSARARPGKRLAIPAVFGVLLVAAQVPTVLASPRATAKPLRPQAPPCTSEPTGSASAGTATPWAEQQLNFTNAWQFTRGHAVTVALVDSGVSANSPQLAGRLTERSVTGTDPAEDCVGHGTGVAGIIAAADERSQGNPFFGVAPDARILSIKITDSDTSQGVESGLLAEGIREAADDGAQVINVSVQVPDTLALRSAVAEAARRQAVVVAAAGNDNQGQPPGPFFPAEYSADPIVFPNVLSVGAVQPDGTLPDFADPNTHVSVVAPGKGVETIAPRGTFHAWDGTSFAAPFISGVAALVRAAHPGLTAAEVVNRIIATADGGTMRGTGAGMVDPLQAVTAVLAGEVQPAAPTPPPSPSKVPVPQRPGADRFGRMLVVSFTGGALGAAALVVAGAVIIPAGRRRGWKPGRPQQPVAPGPPVADEWAR